MSGQPSRLHRLWWILRPLLWAHRVEITGKEHLASLHERSLVVANHVSFLDGPLVAAIVGPRSVFALYTTFAEHWLIKHLVRADILFPLDPFKPLATRHLIAKVGEGRPCVLFPEGRITVTGSLMKVYPGPAYVADKTGSEIVAVHIEGLERSPLSRMAPGQLRKTLFPKVRVNVLPPQRLEVAPEIRGRLRRSAATLQLYDLLSRARYEASDVERTLPEALLDVRREEGGRLEVLEDIEGRKLTYDGLVRGAFALGRQLEAGTAPGERVGVLLPTAIPTALAFFALSFSGRVPAMLNVAAGSANLQSAQHAAGIRTVISSRRFIEQARLQSAVDALAGRVRFVWLEDVREQIGRREKVAALAASLRARRHLAHQKPDDPAVVLFTSGSEGRPKAVVLSHRNILANCAQVAARIDFTSKDRCLNALPLFHSFGLTGGLLLPLLGGVPVFLYPSPLHYRTIPELAYNLNATILFGTPTFLSGYARRADPYDFRSLRLVVAGGERLTDDLFRLYQDRFGLRIYQGYGATETAPILSLETPLHHRAGTVGRLLPDIEWRLEKIAGIEEGGRLHVRGPNVMLGYLRYENPGALEPPEDGWYDTGDIVAVDEEGYVRVLGRAKRFAKVGGEMVSLAAIEEAMAAARPDWRQAVIARHDERKGERLVLVTEDPRLDMPTLRGVIREAGLPDLAVPSEIHRLERIPLLPTGKPDLPAVARLVEEERTAEPAAE
ncbi:AMP-binding protein [Marinimicrococcus flavescens]|uniref:AMP-binding protein n=1 Tax=Marinimicrococcus flavescens TaxID=3031815 RepID=A0AAP3UYC2_9PROT|nr:AMP-binding protein [Marinimicrococcus flavescens]